ncbi:MAG: hypothetical protein IKJ04_00545, partial [Clostridia bacterium]|nr:hypothetical protein [Clostridia bacterium]
RYGANMLLNVGPMANGYLSDIDSAFYGMVGKWVSLFDEAIRLPRPSGIEVESRGGRDFLLRHENDLYLFCFGLPMSADPNAARAKDEGRYEDIFALPEGEHIVSAEWLDDSSPLEFEQREGRSVIKTLPYMYGRNYVVRVARIKVASD